VQAYSNDAAVGFRRLASVEAPVSASRPAKPPRPRAYGLPALAIQNGQLAGGGEMGMSRAGVANYAEDKVALAYRATGAKVARMRKQLSKGAKINNEFTPQEREDMA